MQNSSCDVVGQHDSNSFEQTQFFYGSMYGASYAELVKVCLTLQLSNIEIICMYVWLQHDKAPTHFTITACDTLSQHFLSCWTCQGSPTPPMTWPPPPHSLDLTTSDTLLSQKWQVQQSCGMGCHHYYATNALVHVKQRIVAHQGTLGTRQCTFWSTLYMVTLAKW